jgi:F-type H+-transporting ATPase subunit b
MLIVRLEAGLLDINGTLIAELIAFLLMLGVLARWVYPPIIRAAEARQKQIADQLAAAEKARSDAEQHLRQAEASIQEARVEGQRLIEAARRSAEQVAHEVKDRSEDEARRILEQAGRDIEAERQRAMYALRDEVAELVVTAAQKVVGETLTAERHRQLIERAIEEVSVAEVAPGG